MLLGTWGPVEKPGCQPWTAPLLGCAIPLQEVQGDAVNLMSVTSRRGEVRWLIHANPRAKRSLFPEGSLSYQALGIHHETAEGAEHSQSCSHCFELTLDSKETGLQPPDTGERVP